MTKFTGIVLTAEEIDKQGDMFPSKLVEKINLVGKPLLLEFNIENPIGTILSQEVTERGLEIIAETFSQIKVGQGIGIGGMIKTKEHIPTDGTPPIQIITEFKPLYVSVISNPVYPEWVITEIIDPDEEEPKDL